MTGHAADQAWELAAALGQWGNGVCVWPPGGAGTGPGLGAGSPSAWGGRSPAAGQAVPHRDPVPPPLRCPPSAWAETLLGRGEVGRQTDMESRPWGPGVPCPDHLQARPGSSVPGLSGPLWWGWPHPADHVQCPGAWVLGVGGQRTGPCGASGPPVLGSGWRALRAARVPVLLRVSTPLGCLVAEPEEPRRSGSRGDGGRGAGCAGGRRSRSGPGEVPPSRAAMGTAVRGGLRAGLVSRVPGAVERGAGAGQRWQRHEKAARLGRGPCLPSGAGDSDLSWHPQGWAPVLNSLLCLAGVRRASRRGCPWQEDARGTNDCVYAEGQGWG